MYTKTIYQLSDLQPGDIYKKGDYRFVVVETPHPSYPTKAQVNALGTATAQDLSLEIEVISRREDADVQPVYEEMLEYPIYLFKTVKREVVNGEYTNMDLDDTISAFINERAEEGFKVVSISREQKYGEFADVLMVKESGT